MRLLVTGPRAWTEWEIIDRAFIDVENFFYELIGVTLVEGEAEGLDKMAAEVAYHRGWRVEKHPVKDWYPNGHYDWEAGHKRNQEMVDSGIHVCLAFLMACSKPEHRDQLPHFTHGTEDCIRRAARAGIPIRKYRQR